MNNVPDGSACAIVRDIGERKWCEAEHLEMLVLITKAPAQEPPDVIVADLAMPDEDGLSLLRRVREWENERGLHTPAVALTAYGRVEDRVSALTAGFQTHIAKPVEPTELAAVIATLVNW